MQSISLVSKNQLLKICGSLAEGVSAQILPGRALRYIQEQCEGIEKSFPNAYKKLSRLIEGEPAKVLIIQGVRMGTLETFDMVIFLNGRWHLLTVGVHWNALDEITENFQILEKCSFQSIVKRLIVNNESIKEDLAAAIKRTVAAQR